MSSTLLDHIIFYELHSSWPYNILWAPLFLTTLIFYELRSSWPRRRRRRTWSSTWRVRWTWRCWAREDAEAAAGRRTAGLRSQFKLHRAGRELSFFSSRRNWDSPILPLAGECAPHLLVQARGGRHTRLRERGWASPNSDEGTYTVILYVSTLCEIAFAQHPNLFYSRSEIKERKFTKVKLTKKTLGCINLEWKAKKLILC